MNFNEHGKLEGQHAFLGGSKYHWIYYDEDKLARVYSGYLITQNGPVIHDFAARCIRLKQRLPDIDRTLNMYVNDAIDYGMTPEQILYYSKNCFGTADAIAYNDRVLQIFDLKTGNTPAHIEQLMIYAALFCLEYKIKPDDIDIELRIYQNDEIIMHSPALDDIKLIIEKIKTFDKLINKINEQEGD